MRPSAVRPRAPASDGPAIEWVLRAAAVLALLGGVILLRLVRTTRPAKPREA